MKKLALGVALGISAITASAVATADSIPDKVRVVIGSKSTGGDTYQSSAILAEALSAKLGKKLQG